MILRKPYALLIKHFRLIHALLTILLIYSVYRVSGIRSFFAQYITASNNLNFYLEPTMTSIGFLLYFVIFLAIVIALIIYLLMKKKEKPVRYYLFLIITYSLMLMTLFLANGQMIALAQNRAGLQMMRTIRDLLGLFTFLQYLFIIVSVLRTLGFNIKNFDFQSDLKELKVLEEDNEEFELEFEVDSNDVKTKFKRTLRIAKYILLENKKLIISVLSFTLFFGIIYIILNVTVYNKVYRENETFRYGPLKMKVLNSYETVKSFSNINISENKYYYYVVKTSIENPTELPVSISMSNIELDVAGVKSYSVDTKSYSSFADFGIGYEDDKILPDTNREYIFVFKVDRYYRDDTKTLKIIKEIKNTSKGEEFVFLKTRIKPKNTDEISIKDNKKLKETLSIKNDLIGNVNITIDEYKIENYSTFNYKEEINGKEYSFTGVVNPKTNDYYGKKILKLKTNIEIEKNLNDVMNRKIIGNFVQVRYIKNKKEYINPFDSIERFPSVNDGYKYLEVYDDISDADEIYLNFIIRNEKYVYKIK